MSLRQSASVRASATAAARFACAALVFTVVVASARPARGAGDEVAMAQVLFEDAKRLMARGKWSEACPKLEDSQRLAAAIGTEFNLADCYEHEGRLASAWGAFLEVVDKTHRRGETQREMAARQRADALVKKLGKLTIQVSGARPPDLEVRRDGQVVPVELWGVAMPADAGEHRVEARAEGRLLWSGTIQTKNGEPSVLAVPDLALAPPPPAAAPEAATDAARPRDVAPRVERHPDHTAAGIVLGSAVVFAGVGVVGLLEHASSVSSYNADQSCPPIQASSRPAQCDGYVSSASTWNTIGIVGLVGGGVALAAGITLWVVAPSRRDPPTSQVTCAPGIGSFGCVGVF